jgi:hypothetical protein
MNANHFKQELLALEAKLQDATKNSPAPHQNARQLYFELQRLVHQYASIQVRCDSTKMS